MNKREVFTLFHVILDNNYLTYSNSVFISINHIDLFRRLRVSLKVNRTCQWITVSGVVCKY